MWISKKSFNTPWDDHTRHIYNNFELSNPYQFRKTALNGSFGIQISGFWTPRGGVKKVNFGKSLNTPWDDHTRHISWTPPHSDRKTALDRHFWIQILGFWTPRGVKKASFGKSLNMPWDDHTRHICTNFQLSNPYLFRKMAPDGNFWMQISGFWTPWGVKKANFGKSLNMPWTDHSRHICNNFHLSNP